MTLTPIDTTLNDLLQSCHGAEPLARLVCAMLAGGFIGMERESRGREAGFRTNILVCLGSAIVMIVSTMVSQVAEPARSGVSVTSDPARIAYGVMAGIGFLGGGVIIRDEGHLRGLTTAAGLWCVAGIGLACGLGLYSVAGVATALVLVTLWFLQKVESRFPKSEQRLVAIRRPWSPDCVDTTVGYFVSAGFRVVDVGFERSPDLQQVVIHLHLTGHRNRHIEQAEQQLMRETTFELLSSKATP
jgi:putative Mg2+ transporter-C (MgtC) family protein